MLLLGPDSGFRLQTPASPHHLPADIGCCPHPGLHRLRARQNQQVHRSRAPQPECPGSRTQRRESRTQSGLPDVDRHPAKDMANSGDPEGVSERCP